MQNLTQLLGSSTMYYIGGLFMSYSIRFTKEERKLADAYAKLHGITLSEALKSALFEKIEDEYDIAIAKEAYDEYVNSGMKSRPFEELVKEVGLDKDV